MNMDSLLTFRGFSTEWPDAEPVYEKITPEEFDAIARVEGYIKLDGIDVEALRELRKALREQRNTHVYRFSRFREPLDRVLAAVDQGDTNV